MSEYITSIRRLVGQRRLLVPSTACILVNEREEVLMQLRSDLKMWGCPGGILDIGETVTENLDREVFEETGLRVVRRRLFGIYSGKRYEGRYPNGDETAVVQYVFVVDRFEGTVRACDESLELRYYHIDSLPESIAPHHEEFLRHYVEFRRGDRTPPVIC